MKKSIIIVSSIIFIFSIQSNAQITREKISKLYPKVEKFKVHHSTARMVFKDTAVWFVSTIDISYLVVVDSLNMEISMYPIDSIALHNKAFREPIQSLALRC